MHGSNKEENTLHPPKKWAFAQLWKRILSMMVQKLRDPHPIVYKALQRTIFLEYFIPSFQAQINLQAQIFG